jgi:hypothetical protein
LIAAAARWHSRIVNILKVILLVLACGGRLQSEGGAHRDRRLDRRSRERDRANAATRQRAATRGRSGDELQKPAESRRELSNRVEELKKLYADA